MYEIWASRNDLQDVPVKTTLGWCSYLPTVM